MRTRPGSGRPNGAEQSTWVELPREPAPALLPPDEESAVRLVRSAWAWVARHILGEVVTKKDRRPLAMKRADLAEAVAIMREKSIAPAAWFVFRLRVLKWSTMPNLAAAVGLNWLREGRKRGWFRRATDKLFGGRSYWTPALKELAREYRAGRSPSSSLVTRARREVQERTRELSASASSGALFPVVDLTTWSPL